MDPPEAPSSVVGESAAVAAATLWAVGSLLFASASRRAGPWAVNQFRLFTAAPALCVAFLVQATLFGFEGAPPARQTLLLVVSGVIGLTLGDAALFRAWMILGARRVALLGAVAPIMVALLAAPLLGERLGWAGVAGMAVTLAGILWVLADRSEVGAPVHGSAAEGIALTVVASAGQAIGAVLAKAGLGLADAASPLGAFAAAGDEPVREISPLLAVAIRMSVGAAALALYTVPAGRAREVLPLVTNRDALTRAAGATFLGTFCGVWLSVVAFAHTETGVAQTLLALTPVLVLPMARFATSDRPPLRAWVGALVAVAGVALLALRHRLGGGGE